MSEGIVFDMEQVPDPAQQPEHIHVSRRIVREYIRGIESSRAHLVEPVGPCRKAGRVIVEAFR